MIRKDIKLYIEKLRKGESLGKDDVRFVCERGKQILEKEENVLSLKSPITVCGDVHGQLFDVLEIFEIGGVPPETNYLFVGDYVDRGMYSLETFLLFVCYKILYPGRFSLLRGNHESRAISSVYGFYDECNEKFGCVNVWKNCCMVFDMFPLAAVIDDKVFCIHGGLSPSAKSIDKIRKIERKLEVPHDGPMCDLLWSDPEPEIDGWALSPRNSGYLFGGDVVKRFNDVNNIKMIVRAHQLVMEGYKFIFNDTLCTVWSAPNYYYRCGNIASIMEFDEKLFREMKSFKAAPSSVRVFPEKKNRITEYFL